MDTKLQILGELLIELLVIILLFSNLCEHLEALFDQVFLNDAQDLVLLQSLARDVQGEILRIDDALYKAEPLWDELVAIVHDEDATHIQLDVVALLLGLKHVKGRT